ncbi:hypothetical protein D9M69_529200 [compost metagenome]
MLAIIAFPYAIKISWIVLTLPTPDLSISSRCFLGKVNNGTPQLHYFLKAITNYKSTSQPMVSSVKSHSRRASKWLVECLDHRRKHWVNHRSQLALTTLIGYRVGKFFTHILLVWAEHTGTMRPSRVAMHTHSTYSHT